MMQTGPPKYLMMVAYPAPAAANPVFKWLFVVSGIVSCLWGLFGIGAAVMISINLSNYNEFTVLDAVFIALTILFCIWKTVTECIALSFMLSDDTTMLKASFNYNSLAFIFGTTADSIVLFLTLAVLLTASEELNDLVKNIIMNVIYFSGGYFLFYSLSMLALLKYISQLPIIKYERMVYAAPQQIYSVPAGMYQGSQ